MVLSALCDGRHEKRHRMRKSRRPVPRRRNTGEFAQLRRAAHPPTRPPGALRAANRVPAPFLFLTVGLLFGHGRAEGQDAYGAIDGLSEEVSRLLRRRQGRRLDKRKHPHPHRTRRPLAQNRPQHIRSESMKERARPPAWFLRQPRPPEVHEVIRRCLAPTTKSEPHRMAPVAAVPHAMPSRPCCSSTRRD